jgi:AraC-like DNA-binding protein
LAARSRRISTRAISTHIHDLIALTIGGDPDAMALTEGRGARAARLQANKADISRNAGDVGLTIAAVASRHRVTPRYIHKLFETEDVTFSEFVLTRRLAVAHRLLTDRRFAHRSTTSIAFDSGFADLSYFNRVFRRLYRHPDGDKGLGIHASALHAWRITMGGPWRLRLNIIWPQASL